MPVFYYSDDDLTTRVSLLSICSSASSVKIVFHNARLARKHMNVCQPKEIWPHNICMAPVGVRNGVYSRC
jgi:hypothetical protein